MNSTFLFLFQFEPIVVDNPTFEFTGKNEPKGIQDYLYDIGKLPDLACLALFILTHGEEKGILHAYDSVYSLNQHIIPELLPDKCPSLAGKPKMIFIQACQGKYKVTQNKIWNCFWL